MLWQVVGCCFAGFGRNQKEVTTLDWRKVISTGIDYPENRENLLAASRHRAKHGWYLGDRVLSRL